MRILVVTFYYEPDLSAGSFRTTPLVAALAEMMPSGSHIDVITTQPNRYRSYVASAPAEERNGNVSVFRIALPQHQSGIRDQAFAFGAFVRGALRQVKGVHYDLVFATSGRLMTAALGSLIARKTGALLYLDIRDIFVDTIADLLLGRLAGIARPVFGALERWTINRAAHVNLVSRGFEPYFAKRYPTQHFSYITNGIDEAFLREAPERVGPIKSATGENPITVLYAGNIGQGQGLHFIIPQLARRMGATVRFRIIGDGGRRAALEEAVKSEGVSNVEIVAPVSRAKLMEEYRTTDVLFVQLGDFPALTTVIPSKLFEYGALGKPIWAGVAGFTAAFVKTEISNAAVFHPCDVDGALEAFRGLRLQDEPRADFCAKFARGRLSRLLAEDLLNACGPARPPTATTAASGV